MVMQIIASDLDGTLLNEESEINESTIEAVRMAQCAGIRFIAVTGRSWNTAHSILREAGINGDYVLLNGAEFRTSSGKVIYQESIENYTAKKIIKYLSDVGIDFEINTDMGDYSTDTNICEAASEIPDFKQFWNRNPKILKIFIFSDISTHLGKIRKNLQYFNGITITSSAVCNIEVTSADAGKGMMLKKAAEYYQVSKEDVVVFGNGENDESMFREFSHSRAVENAVPIIRCLAEKVIDSNQNNGVAKEINHILGGI